MDLEKAYNKWQCTDIEEEYINNIEPTQFTKSELFSFAEFYHKEQVKNNGVLDDVSNCPNCKSDCIVKGFNNYYKCKNCGSSFKRRVDY
jgi:transposase-like protein